MITLRLSLPPFGPLDPLDSGPESHYVFLLSEGCLRKVSVDNTSLSTLLTNPARKKLLIVSTILSLSPCTNRAPTLSDGVSKRPKSTELSFDSETMTF